MKDPQFAIRQEIRAAIEERGRGTKSALADHLGVRLDAITRMLNDDPKKETREIKAHELEAIRLFFRISMADDNDRTPEDDEEGEDTVPIVGYVGAGAAAHYYAVSQGDLGRAKRPHGGTADTVAVEIRGESLGKLFNQWLVYYDQVHSPLTPDMVGKLCVVGLHNDQVLVKQIKRSKVPGLYDLISNTDEEPIRGVEIAWAARVRTMVPRDQ